MLPASAPFGIWTGTAPACSSSETNGWNVALIDVQRGADRQQRDQGDEAAEPALGLGRLRGQHRAAGTADPLRLRRAAHRAALLDRGRAPARARQRLELVVLGGIAAVAPGGGPARGGNGPGLRAVRVDRLRLGGRRRRRSRPAPPRRRVHAQRAGRHVPAPLAGGPRGIGRPLQGPLALLGSQQEMGRQPVLTLHGGDLPHDRNHQALSMHVGALHGYRFQHAADELRELLLLLGVVLAVVRRRPRRLRELVFLVPHEATE